MPTMKLTDKAVAAAMLPPGEEELILWDGVLQRFGLRLRRRRSDGPTVKRFICQYRRAGGSRKQTIGSPDVLSVEDARKEAKKILAKVALGHDPAAERRERRDKDKVTLRSVVDEYLAAKRGELRAKTMREIERYLTAPPYFGPLFRMPIDTVTRRDVALRVAAITREHGPIVARRARAALSAFFVWAMRMGIVEHNVVIGTIEPKGNGPRERTLSDDELGRVWRACQDDDYGRIIKLAILLGARRQEIGGMRESEFSDLDGPQPSWTIPAARSKSGRPLTLPLLPMAAEIVRSVPRLVSRDQLFGSYSSQGFANWDRGKRALDARSGVTGWTPHDLRRTLSTRLHDLNTPPHIVEAVLGHVGGHKSGVAGRYNWAAYKAQIRSALATWEDYVRSIVEGGERKVLVLPQQSA